MIELELQEGEHRRLWVVSVTDTATGDTVSLPPGDDWHASVKLLNVLAGMYGEDAVALYQWDISRVFTGRHEDTA